MKGGISEVEGGGLAETPLNLKRCDVLTKHPAVIPNQPNPKSL